MFPGWRILLRTRSVHLKERGVQEQFQGFLLPGALGVGVAAQRAQQLRARPEAGRVVGAERGWEEDRVKVRGCPPEENRGTQPRDLLSHACVHPAGAPLPVIA